MLLNVPLVPFVTYVTWYYSDMCIEFINIHVKGTYSNIFLLIITYHQNNLKTNGVDQNNSKYGSTIRRMACPECTSKHSFLHGESKVARTEQ